ncbi:26S proteasome non-ATPase regulatory subunit 1 homolog A-like protein [Tanacetum coccineum]
MPSPSPSSPSPSPSSPSPSSHRHLHNRKLLFRISCQCHTYNLWSRMCLLPVFVGTYRPDLLIIKRTKESIEMRDSIFHSATIYANALMHVGTTIDIFLRENMVDTSHLVLSDIQWPPEARDRLLMVSYLPQNGYGGGSRYSEGNTRYQKQGTMYIFIEKLPSNRFAIQVNRLSPNTFLAGMGKHYSCELHVIGVSTVVQTVYHELLIPWVLESLNRQVGLLDLRRERWLLSKLVLIKGNKALPSASFVGAMAIADLVKMTLGTKGMVGMSLVRWATPQLHDMDALAKMVDPPDEFDRLLVQFVLSFEHVADNDGFCHFMLMKLSEEMGCHTPVSEDLVRQYIVSNSISSLNNICDGAIGDDK